MLKGGKDFNSKDLIKSEVINDIKKRSGSSYPLLVNNLNKLKGDSYKKLFDSALSLLNNTYGLGSSVWVGFNENWAIELFPTLAMMYPKAKFLIIYRDPRASIASALKQKDVKKKIQVYSFACGWRKNIAFMLQYQSNKLFKDRLIICKYENFVKRPDQELKKILYHLNIEYLPEMLDPQCFKDGEGKTWKGNSYIHKIKPKGIYKDSINAWKNNLEPRIVKSIEFITWAELKLLGYETYYSDKLFLDKEALNFFYEDANVESSWKSSKLSLDQRIGMELFRSQILKSCITNLSINKIKKYFLFTEAFHYLHNISK